MSGRLTVLRLPLPDPLRQRAEADAQRRRLNLRAWAIETIQAHLAGCSCTHVGRATSAADADGEPDDDAEAGPVAGAPDGLAGR